MKTNSFRIFMLLAMFWSINGAFCQNDLANHKKYWYYKSRLNNDFIKIGNTPTNNSNLAGHGESIPFNERGQDAGGNGFDPLGNLMHAGDATTRLGIYIAALATEYRLLKNNNQDVTGIKHELFCALNAVNRIDYHAEEQIWPNQNPNLNGFFIRGDIPKNFVKENYEHFNYFNKGVDASNFPIDSTHQRGFTQTYQQAMTSTNQDYPVSVQEESQDQMYYLLLGLTLTNKLVDAYETDGLNVFGYGSGQTLLATEAGKIAERMLTYVTSDPWSVIKNPNTGNAVGIGAYAAPFAYALDNLGCFIKQGQTLPYFSNWGYPFCNGTNFRNNASTNLGTLAAWQGIALNGGGPTPDEQGFFNCLAGTSNSSYQNLVLVDLDIQSQIQAAQDAINNALNQIQTTECAIFTYYGFSCSGAIPGWLQGIADAANYVAQNLLTGLYSLVATLVQAVFPVALINTTDDRLTFNSTGNSVAYWNFCVSNLSFTHVGSKQYFGIYTRDLLHFNNPSLPSPYSFLTPPSAAGHLQVFNDVKNILNDAPCDGNYNFNPIGASVGRADFPAANNWGGTNFIDRPDGWWKKSCGTGGGEFSVTEYLLLHNLFYLREGVSSNPIVDFINRKLTFNMPVGGSFVNNNKTTFGAYEFIEATNSIASNGGAVVRAGKQVALLNGFSATSGSDIDVIINPFPGTCSNDAMRSSGPSQNSDPFTTDYSAAPSGVIAPKQEEKQEMQPQVTVNTGELDNALKNAINESNQKLKAIVGHDLVKVYPNPTSGLFTVETDTNEGEKNIIITDALGNIVFDLGSTYFNKVDIDFSTKAKGIYLVKFISKAYPLTVIKLTVN